MGWQKGLALVAGAGASLCQSLLARFEAGIFTPANLGCTKPKTTIGAFHTLDVARPEPAVIYGINGDYGPPSTMVHSIANLFIAPSAVSSFTGASTRSVRVIYPAWIFVLRHKSSKP